MDLDTNPLLQRLQGARRVIVSGCGGGHDLYAGLPLYLWLKKRVDTVLLGNLSFAELRKETGKRRTVALTEVDADTPGSDEFFPERALCRWFRKRGENISVFCFSRTGARTLAHSWQALVDEMQLDAVVLADGGTDSLLRGDEATLGTPSEDLANIAAVHTLKIPCKILTCLGFGVDAFDQVCHAHVLETVAALQARNAFLGAFSLLPGMRESKLFLEAVQHAVDEMPGSPSVVAGSIASAIEGRFGDYHKTWRTSGNKLFISPLMSMYWSFDLDAVAKRCLYLPELLETRSYEDVDRAIAQFRKQYPPLRGWETIPY